MMQYYVHLLTMRICYFVKYLIQLTQFLHLDHEALFCTIPRLVSFSKYNQNAVT